METSYPALLDYTTISTSSPSQHQVLCCTSKRAWYWSHCYSLSFPWDELDRSPTRTLPTFPVSILPPHLWFIHSPRKPLLDPGRGRQRRLPCYHPLGHGSPCVRKGLRCATSCPIYRGEGVRTTGSIHDYQRQTRDNYIMSPEDA